MKKKSNYTRALNPKLGFLGFFGFLGFAGIWTYLRDGSIEPFVFFLFFGFFGFFYEAKVSSTFMDERFRENMAKAEAKANRIAVVIVHISLIFLSQGRLFGSNEYTLIAFIVVLSLAMALRLFLCPYLLYKYDHDDLSAEED